MAPLIPAYLAFHLSSPLNFYLFYVLKQLMLNTYLIGQSITYCYIFWQEFYNYCRFIV